MNCFWNWTFQCYEIFKLKRDSLISFKYKFIILGLAADHIMDTGVKSSERFIFAVLSFLAQSWNLQWMFIMAWPEGHSLPPGLAKLTQELVQTCQKDVRPLRSFSQTFLQGNRLYAIRQKCSKEYCTFNRLMWFESFTD